MATNIIKIKRTTGSTAPSSLNAGELAFSGGTGTAGNMGQRLFIGDPANSNAVTVIGGNYFANLMDHAHGTTTASSGLIVDANKSTSELRTAALYIGTSGSDTLVTSTAAELNILDGVTSTAAELNLIDGSIAGTVVASKAVVVDSNKDIASFRNVTLTGELDAATLDISGNADIDGTTNLDDTDIDGSLTVDGAIDLNATTLDIDATDDIDIDTSDTTGGIAIGTANSGVPISIGHTTSEVTVNDNMTVTGNLTVSGTTTTVNSTTVSIADPIFELGASGSDDNLDRGIKMKYNSSGAKFAFMGFDDSDGKFAFIPDATDTSSVFSGTQGTIKANIEVGSGGSSFRVGDSYPFSDSSGTLTLTNIDGIDATTESTFETAIDSLTNLTAVGEIVTGTWSATAIAVNKGGTGLTSVGSSGQIPVSNGSAFVMQDIDGGTYS
jgi:cytoskeletal protein CcmA (bactofilin family)